MNAIEVKELTKVYGEQRAVDGLTFEVPAGRITGFLGPNGAGKSTTLQVLLGLGSPTEGEATIFGRRYRDLEEPTSLVGVLLDSSQVHPARTGRRHLEVRALAAGVPLQRVDEVLAEVDLSDAGDKRVGAYSLGMRQRLGLAGALLGSPQVLVLDEPANGLDPAGIRWLRLALRRFAAGGGTVLLSSHQLSEVAEMVDEVVVIDHGKLVVKASIGDLIARGVTKVRVRTSRPQALVRALEELGVAAEETTDDELVAEATTEQIGDLALEIGMPIYGLRVEDKSLEDVFLELTEGSEYVDIAG